MKTLSVQVTEDGILIPEEYLQKANEFEAKKQNGYILVRPKEEESASSSELLPSESSRFSFVGIARSNNPNASIEVEEILQEELGLNVLQADE